MSAFEKEAPNTPTDLYGRWQPRLTLPPGVWSGRAQDGLEDTKQMIPFHCRAGLPLSTRLIAFAMAAIGIGSFPNSTGTSWGSDAPNAAKCVHRSSKPA